MYKVIYPIFLFCCSVLALQTYGLPLTIRQISAFLMFFVCLYIDKRIWMDKIFSIYLIFVLFYGISGLVTGYFEDFVLRLFGDYFVAYVAIWAVKILIVKYKAEKVFFSFFLFLGLFDGFITFYQFMGWSFMDSILNQLQLISYRGYLDNYQGTGVEMFLRCPPGIYSHPTLNAHVLLACTILTLSFFFRYKFYVGITISSLMVIFLFATQQRTAFLAGLACVFFFFYLRSFRSKYKIIFIPAFLILSFFILQEFFNFVSAGSFRFGEMKMDSSGRDYIYNQAIAFIINNPFGGISKFLATTGWYPHNLFFNSLIYGGWIGGIALLYIILLQIKKCIITLLNKNVPIDEILLSLTVLALILNGITHNQSIVNAEIVTWTIWGCLYYQTNSKLKLKSYVK